MRVFGFFILLSCLIVLTPALAVAQCLYCDDFDQGNLPADWTYLRPGWAEPAGGYLIGTPAHAKAIAIASPAFAGCTACSIEASLQTGGGAGNRVWLLGWYLDSRNTIELMMNQETGKWVIKQRANGRVVAKAKASATILPGVSYDVLISYDSARFIVTIDGAPLIGLNPAAPVPNGTVGFQVKRTTGAFDFMTVNDVAGSPIPAGAYAYLAYHNGLLVVKGWMQFDNLNPSGFTGSWHMEPVAPDPDIGPQLGDGTLEGSASQDGKYFINLDPSTFDSNVYLSGRIDGAVYQGSWQYDTLGGLNSWGAFDCRQE